VKRLIVNGDDFGLSSEVNAGILRAHRDGVLTTASLMVAESGAEAAARTARENPRLDVGLHVVVCKGRCVMPPERMGRAVDSAGRFPDNPVVAGMRWFFDGKARAHLRGEIRAQIERHLDLVGYLNHIDGHLNFHVHPAIADILVELAVEYKVPCMRLPLEPAGITIGLRRDHLARKLVESVIFKTLSRRARRMMRERGLKFTDRLFGLHQSGHLDEDYVLSLIERLGEGTTELYLHPAADIGGTPPAAEAQLEVEILTSPRVREALRAGGVELITFADLACEPNR
jgi:hopanoid biosynthesis associated protein HpnK